MGLQFRIEEIVDHNDLDIKHIKIHDKLFPMIWENEEKMKPIVRKTLLRIAQKFFETLKLPDTFDLKDIIMTGSLANFNYNSKSDIDVHLIIDFNDLDMDKNVAQEYFDSKKDLWSQRLDIHVYGHDVECYVQDLNDTLSATGVYSLIKDEWVNKPQRKIIVIDKKKIIKKAEEIARFIDKIEKESNRDMLLQNIKKIKEKIKKMRQTGLDNKGEYSIENLVFKVLRYNGYLQKLNDLKIDFLNKNLSLENKASN